MFFTSLKGKTAVALVVIFSLMLYGQFVDEKFAADSEQDLSRIVKTVIPVSNEVLEVLRGLENQYEHYQRAVFSIDREPLLEAKEKSLLVHNKLIFIKEAVKDQSSLITKVESLMHQHVAYTKEAGQLYSQLIKSKEEPSEAFSQKIFRLGMNYNEIHQAVIKLREDIQEHIGALVTHLQQAISTRKHRLFIVLIIKVFTTLLLTIGFYYLIIRRLNILTKASGRLRKDLRTQVPSLGSDELGLLAVTIEEMRENINHHQENLEILVEKRTDQISKLAEKQEQIADKLSCYIPPQVYRSIFNGEKDATLGSHRKPLTVFFSDIAGFTTITDRLESETLNLLLNNYLNDMTNICMKYGGTLDKFIGDAIMIFFGDPLSNGEKEDALNCVKMAIEMRERMHDLREEWEKSGIAQSLNIRIGINSGYCTVGNFGSENRMNYTIIGGNVNLASRLEHHAPIGEISISKETFLLIKDEVECIKLKPIKVKGISYDIEPYQVINIMSESGSRSKIRKETDGLTIELDLNKIGKTELPEARKCLQDMLLTLDNSLPDITVD